MGQELIDIIGIGITLAGLQLTGLRSLHERIDRFKARMAHLEGMREAISGGVDS